MIDPSRYTALIIFGAKKMHPTKIECKGRAFERGGGGLGRTFIHKGSYLMTLKDIYIVLLTQIAYGFGWEKPLFEADTHRL